MDQEDAAPEISPPDHAHHHHAHPLGGVGWTIDAGAQSTAGKIMVDLGHFLEGLQNGSQVVLALVLGAMISFDMGGPVNKAAFFFAPR